MTKSLGPSGGLKNSRHWNRRWRKKREQAELRGLEFLLSLAEFRDLYSNAKACAYCGFSFTEARLPTMDRVHAAYGYVLENIQMLCSECNSLKGVYEWGGAPVHRVRIFDDD